MQSKNKFTPGAGCSPGPGVVREWVWPGAGEAAGEATVEPQKVRKLALVGLR